MMKTERDEFSELLPNVSRETLAKLDRYAEMLGEWNLKFNLVAESTLPHIWKRHFLDSAQLIKYIPETAQNMADMGSGAGFPGLVLSIMGVQNVHLIDGTGKKANFLRAVVEELKLDAIVHQARVEEMRDLKADVITARAMAPLLELMKYANYLTFKESTCLFLKGQNAETELTESAKYWTFNSKKIKSLSDDSGSVLVIENLKWKNAAPHKKRNKD